MTYKEVYDDIVQSSSKDLADLLAKGVSPNWDDRTRAAVLQRYLLTYCLGKTDGMVVGFQRGEKERKRLLDIIAELQ